jgi:hypothetical protein
MTERQELMSDRMAVVLAAILAAVTMIALSALPVAERRITEGVMLAIVAAIYIGFALAERSGPNLAIELAFATAIVVIVFVGLGASRYWIAGGLAAHGVWDLLHHHRHPVIGTRELPRWYPPACLVFDFPIAAFVALVPA